MKEQQIIRNAAKCRKCGDIIESHHVHDYVVCKCGAISVDGGHEYFRHGGNIEDIEDMSAVTVVNVPEDSSSTSWPY